MASRSNAKQVFKNLQAKFEQVKREAPKVLANEGQKAFLDNFKTESFDNKKWKEVQRREPGTYAYKYPKSKDLARRSRPILIGKTRRLRNATANSVKQANSRRIKWANYLPYSEVQNEKRTFMGIDNKFKKRLKDKFEQLYRSRIK